MRSLWAEVLLVLARFRSSAWRSPSGLALSLALSPLSTHQPRQAHAHTPTPHVHEGASRHPASHPAQSPRRATHDTTLLLYSGYNTRVLRRDYTTLHYSVTAGADAYGSRRPGVGRGASPLLHHKILISRLLAAATGKQGSTAPSVRVGLACVLRV